MGTRKVKKINVHAFLILPITPFLISRTPTIWPQKEHPTSSASAQLAMAIAVSPMCPD